MFHVLSICLFHWLDFFSFSLVISFKLVSLIPHVSLQCISPLFDVLLCVKQRCWQRCKKGKEIRALAHLCLLYIYATNEHLRKFKDNSEKIPRLIEFFKNLWYFMKLILFLFTLLFHSWCFKFFTRTVRFKDLSHNNCKCSTRQFDLVYEIDQS